MIGSLPSIAVERLFCGRWERVTRWKLAAFSLGLVAFLGWVAVSEPGFVWGLDFANLLFHEAGHPIFGMFSERLGVYGGTLGQLAFPALLMVSFWRKGQAVSFAAAAIWFFENWLNIARYMADARALELPLLGGGEHDWNDIFFRWNVLSQDVAIASATRFCGWLGIVSVAGWIFWRGWRDLRAARRSELGDP
jgi:hypothetical protein